MRLRHGGGDCGAARSYIVANMSMTSAGTQDSSGRRRSTYIAEGCPPVPPCSCDCSSSRCAAARSPRTEMEVLSTLREGPRRITELTELQGIAQPTMTLLVTRMQEKGWVEREGVPGGQACLHGQAHRGGQQRRSSASVGSSSQPCGRTCRSYPTESCRRCRPRRKRSAGLWMTYSGEREMTVRSTEPGARRSCSTRRG